jgi:hypothetical protein
MIVELAKYGFWYPGARRQSSHCEEDFQGWAQSHACARNNELFVTTQEWDAASSPIGIRKKGLADGRVASTNPRPLVKPLLMQELPTVLCKKAHHKSSTR